jgi:hypothetical protein
MLCLALDANLPVRQPNSEPHPATDELSIGKLWEASTGLVLSSAHQGPFIPWALYAVERAFSKSLQNEAEYDGNQNES